MVSYDTYSRNMNYFFTITKFSLDKTYDYIDYFKNKLEKSRITDDGEYQKKGLTINSLYRCSIFAFDKDTYTTIKYEDIDFTVVNYNFSDCEEVIHIS